MNIDTHTHNIYISQISLWNIIGDSFAIAIILKTEEQKSQKQEPKMSVHNTTITIKTILNKQLDRNLDKKKTTTKIPV